MDNPLKRLITKLGGEDPLLLAHHPTCEYYSHHVIEVYGQKLCMGCFVVYPVAFTSLVTLVIARATFLSGPISGIPTLTLYGTGGALLLPKVATKVVLGTWTRNVRILTKALLAVGLAVIALPFVFRPADRLSTALLFFGFLIPYVAYKGWTATDDCQGCPEVDDFPNCSGLSFDGTYSYSDSEIDENN